MSDDVDPTSAQNMYDNPHFFSAYSSIERSTKGLTETYEWEMMRRLVGSVHGLRILDLGCGFGFSGRWAIENGAQSVRGLDLSEKMLARATELTDKDALKSGKVSFIRADLETLKLEARSHDLVYSTLALHYVTKLKDLLGEAFRTLVLGDALF